jgi:ATP-binding cassette subfamily B protein/subfamily B ATP-binding cassette protein MsbA
LKNQNNILEVCRWALAFAFRRPLPLAGVIVSMLLKVGLDVLKPWPMIFLVDYVLGRKVMPQALADFVATLPGAAIPAGLIGWSVAATVVIFLLSWTVGLAHSYANISLGQRMTYDLAADLFARLQQLSLRFHSSRSVGDSIRRVTADANCVAVIVRDALLPIVASLVTIISFFAILWQQNSTLALIALAVVPYMAVIFGLYAQPMLDRSFKQQEAESRIYEVSEQTFAAIPVVQAFGREEWHDRQLATATQGTLEATVSLTNIQLRFKILMGLSTAVGTAMILWIGGRHALADQTSVGTILLFLSYLASLYDPLASLMYTSSTIQAAAGSAKRVREVLEKEREVVSKPGARALASVRGEVKFDNITFGYEPNRPVLQGISLEVKPGETIALVGPTGAGKSTLASLIPRFFDPWNGRVLVDGNDVRDVDLKSLRQNVGLVLQEPFLFPLTIAENIAYGCPQASQAQIESVARAASAHEFIQRLPQGYRTVVGERGATLSGGERQRISIARALLKNAPILIFDEPTSALDAATEQAFLQALDQLREGRSTFIIAHRLSTVRRANRIIVLDQGRIIETGQHDDLVRAGGFYARLCQIQFGDVGQASCLSSHEPEPSA